MTFIIESLSNTIIYLLAGYYPKEFPAREILSEIPGKRFRVKVEATKEHDLDAGRRAIKLSHRIFAPSTIRQPKRMDSNQEF